jgi:dihydroxy-acid dehydratase
VQGDEEMKRELRSNKVNNFMRRAHWLTLGLSDADMEKPKIAIVNSSSDIAVCFSHLDEIAKKMREAIRAAGGIAFEVRTVAPSDAFTGTGHGGYIQSSRDLVVNDIEIGVEGAVLDGMVCLASCDKTLPAQLMAAGRLNIPTLIMACGYQPSGKYLGDHFDFEDLFLHIGHLVTGRVTAEEMKAMSEVAILGPGVCPGMGTANSMHCACEALGMTLPGSTPVLANSTKMWQTVRHVGERIVEMVWEDLKPRDIMKTEAFTNAAKVMLCVSGSINTLKHLQAVANEAHCDVDVYDLYDRYASEIPLLTAVRPNGHHTIEEFEAAGGTRAIMRQLEGVLELGARTVTGRTVGEILQETTVDDEEVIRPFSRPLSTRPSINLVRGSLAPNSAIIKLAVVDDRPLHFSGPAVIYEDQNAAIEALNAGNIKEGDVVVLRGLGLRGGPGFGHASGFVFALDGSGLTGRVAVVTDGHASGLVNKTLLAVEVTPEAAEGGPLALVENGDIITIDVDRKTIDLEVSEELLSERCKSLLKSPEKKEIGWLSIYRRTVRPLHEGAGLIE